MTNNDTHRPERVTLENGQRMEGAGWPMLVARGCSGNIWLDARSWVCLDCNQVVSARLMAHTEEVEARLEARLAEEREARG